MIKVVIAMATTLLLLGGLYGKALGDIGEQRQELVQLKEDLDYQKKQTEKANAERERVEQLLTDNRAAREAVRQDIARLRAQLREDRRHASEQYQECVELDVPDASFERLRSLALEADG